MLSIHIDRCVVQNFEKYAKDGDETHKLTLAPLGERETYTLSSKVSTGGPDLSKAVVGEQYEVTADVRLSIFKTTLYIWVNQISLRAKSQPAAK